MKFSTVEIKNEHMRPSWLGGLEELHVESNRETCSITPCTLQMGLTDAMHETRGNYSGRTSANFRAIIACDRAFSFTRGQNVRTNVNEACFS